MRGTGKVNTQFGEAGPPPPGEPRYVHGVGLGTVPDQETKALRSSLCTSSIRAVAAPSLRSRRPRYL